MLKFSFQCFSCKFLMTLNIIPHISISCKLPTVTQFFFFFLLKLYTYKETRAQKHRNQKKFSAFVFSYTNWRQTANWTEQKYEKNTSTKKEKNNGDINLWIKQNWPRKNTFQMLAVHIVQKLQSTNQPSSSFAIVHLTESRLIITATIFKHFQYHFWIHKTV